jgi:phosphatidylserine/phosphatidylglycerophosphate/cardiolipin synthase-like enzyme
VVKLVKNETELVLTLPEILGPEKAHLTHARTTLGALTQMVAQSEDELIIAAPYIREDILGESILQAALEHAVLQRHVDISIATTGESLDRFSNIPWIVQNRSRVHLFRPKSNVDFEPNIGSHAKFCISDKRIAYIGSANITFLGLHKHLEMGVLVYDEMANQVYDFWKLLVRNEFLIEDWA